MPVGESPEPSESNNALAQAPVHVALCGASAEDDANKANNEMESLDARLMFARRKAEAAKRAAEQAKLAAQTAWAAAEEAKIAARRAPLAAASIIAPESPSTREPSLTSDQAVATPPRAAIGTGTDCLDQRGLDGLLHETACLEALSWWCWLDKDADVESKEEDECAESAPSSTVAARRRFGSAVAALATAVASSLSVVQCALAPGESLTAVGPPSARHPPQGEGDGRDGGLEVIVAWSLEVPILRWRRRSSPSTSRSLFGESPANSLLVCQGYICGADDVVGGAASESVALVCRVPSDLAAVVSRSAGQSQPQQYYSIAAPMHILPLFFATLTAEQRVELARVLPFPLCSTAATAGARRSSCRHSGMTTGDFQCPH